MNKRGFPEKEWQQVLMVMAITVLLYYPVFFSEYVYTDEAVQLWSYRPGEHFGMFIPQGRYLTDLLMDFMFSRISTIDEIRHLRILSLVGWLLVIPVWFRIIRNIFLREQLPAKLVPLIILLLVACPTVTISVGWASCMELFIAYTAGLISGYLAYLVFVTDRASFKKQLLLLLFSLVTGLVSLFTYQNGIGCSLLPFIIYCVARPNVYGPVYKGIVFFFTICLVYYALFTWQMAALGIVEGDRNSLTLSFVKKIRFFFTKPLTGVLHFNYLVVESSRIGVAVSMIVLLVTGFFYSKKAIAPTDLQPTGARTTGGSNASIHARLIQLIAIILLLFLTYLPSMIVRENFASNRTLLALYMAVGCWVMITAEGLIRGGKGRALIVTAAAIFLISNAWYNYNYQFRKPIEKEYQALRRTIRSIKFSDTTAYYVVRPPEDLFIKRYGVTRSWDEFAVPSAFFGWVPSFVARQVWLENGIPRNRLNAASIKTFLLADLPAGNDTIRKLASQHRGDQFPLVWTDPASGNKTWIIFDQGY